MLAFDVNWLAVIVAAVASMVIGFAWFATPIFGRAWMRETGKTAEQIKKGSNAGLYLGAAVGALITAYGIALLVENAVPVTIMDAILLAVFAWLAFFVVPTFMNFAFEGRSWMLFTIYIGHHLVNFLAMMAIYWLWPMSG